VVGIVTMVTPLAVLLASCLCVAASRPRFRHPPGLFGPTARRMFPLACQKHDHHDGAEEVVRRHGNQVTLAVHHGATFLTALAPAMSAWSSHAFASGAQTVAYPLTVSQVLDGWGEQNSRRGTGVFGGCPSRKS